MYRPESFRLSKSDTDLPIKSRRKKSENSLLEGLYGFVHAKWSGSSRCTMISGKKREKKKKGERRIDFLMLKKRGIPE